MGLTQSTTLSQLFTIAFSAISGAVRRGAKPTHQKRSANATQVSQFDGKRQRILSHFTSSVVHCSFELKESVFVPFAASHHCCFVKGTSLALSTTPNLLVPSKYTGDLDKFVIVSSGKRHRFLLRFATLRMLPC